MSGGDGMFRDRGVGARAGGLLLAGWTLAVAGLADDFRTAVMERTATSPPAVREVEIKVPRSGPSIVAVGGDQSVWTSLARAGKLLRLRPSGEQQVYDLPAGSFPVGLLVDPQERVWYGDIRRNRLVRLDPATSELKEYEIPTPESWPFFLVFAPDGRLYFTERMGNKIGRLDPHSGKIEEFPVTTPHAQPAGMTVTPDGQIFFTQNSANKVGRFDPTADRLTELQVPSPATPGPYYGPAGIASDSQGNVWFAELDGRLGLIRREERGRIEEVFLPDPEVRPGGVVVDRWGLVWFTGLDGNVVMSYDPQNALFRSYRIPSGAPDDRPMSPPEISARGELPVPGLQARSTRPFGIAVDAAGRVWFSEQYGHRLGYVEPRALDVASPKGVLSTPFAAVRTVQRHPDDRPLRYFLDGEPVEPDGQLDLTRLSLGAHRWEVVTEGEPAQWAGSEFVVEPSLEMVTATLHQFLADRRGDPARRLDEQLAAAHQHLAAGNSELSRQALRSLLRALEAEEGTPTPEPLLQQLRYLSLFGALTVEVEAGSAGCRPSEVVVATGDRVRWRGSEENVLGMRLLALDGSFSSPALGGDEGWTRRFDREGKVGYLCGDGARAAVVVRARTADVREIPMLGPGRIPTVVALDDSGNVWFTAGGGGYASLADVPLNNKIGWLSPDGELHEVETSTPESAPTSIKVAPDGSVWFTARGSNKIGHFVPSTDTLTEFEVPTPRSAPVGLAIDARGIVWFTEKRASKVGRFDPRNERFEEFPTPHPDAEPSTVVIDHDGFVWFDERGADHLVRLDPATGELMEFQVPTEGSRVIGLVPDPRGFIWFLELAGHKIGRLEVATGQIVEFTIPTPFATPFKAALDPHGRLWFTEVYGNRLGVLQEERFFELALPREGSMPGGIEIAPDGTVWFAQQATEMLTRLPQAAAVFVPWGSDRGP